MQPERNATRTTGKKKSGAKPERADLCCSHADQDNDLLGNPSIYATPVSPDLGDEAPGLFVCQGANPPKRNMFVSPPRGSHKGLEFHLHFCSAMRAKQNLSPSL
ncbi:hypothetical protein AVEN_117084-1 [Araneus ventricosus]|uniref:Uncharacterized protein n=1 Tax=Araneus ventricosus TaxID=182803 RepID=A0A4Y2MW81_ARAVE|nr:hypothetical protein AVEN_228776-1 [Araneus ventricosus]GBN31409.1 hypothetical protein AVEN_58362-1 [Araneus ventricosus]GBN31421.1 hypothetical protein AVEN_76640-1 [Araneus ventricosus]GBN31443.1 hypothetical protein AVEN_117084-1 [Araneus ventricosus]